MPAYLDNAATTPMRPEAVQAMMTVLAGRSGNPSGAHWAARAARRAIDDARDTVADLLGADPGEVVFTSGGTESDNLAVLGTMDALARVSRAGPVVCAAMEHHAVGNAAAAAAVAHGVELRSVPSDPRGLVDLDALADACTPEVALVSVMAVNNEIGTVQPLHEVAAVLRAGSPAAVFHTDAVQAVGWTDVSTLVAPADLVSVSAHKFGGPTGVGALVCRGRTPLVPVLHGGEQERGRRSGTPNVAGIVAMAAALEVAVRDREPTGSRVSALRDRLVDGLLASVADVTETGDRASKVAGNAHLCIDGVESEALVVLLDDAGVAASAGAFARRAPSNPATSCWPWAATPAGPPRGCASRSGGRRRPKRWTPPSAPSRARWPGCETDRRAGTGGHVRRGRLVGGGGAAGRRARRGVGGGGDAEAVGW